MIAEKKRLLKIIFFLSLFGIVLSSYLLNLHYIEAKKPCDINETLSCSKVSSSKYSELLGIPVALFGLLGYVFLGLLSLESFYQKKLKLKIVWLKGLFSSRTIFLFSLLALLFSFYLTYAEFFLIKALCILCLVSQITIMGISLSGYKLNRLENSLEENKEEYHGAD
ncbi:MAG: vitamin K epoxide reductase family protein [Nanoarchaeota archaeon]|nr:vitamin K epoxide reductase family protein [Nanoarchaeota archaeon]MBU1622486.1 vitamin K epoxide reductase family protein [Nanoarchaeota archaeon]